MAGIETIVDEQERQEVTVRGKKYQIGVLSALQVLKLTKFVIKVAKNGTDRLKRIPTDKATIMEDAIEIMSVFDEQELAEFISILIKEQDKEFCKEITIGELTSVVVLICEKNDVGVLLGNALRAVEAIKKGLGITKK